MKIGIILGSTRITRISPRIAQCIVDIIQSYEWDESFSLTLIDLKEWNLPILDEPAVPALIKNSEGYKSELTKSWSREISSYDGFIFVTPQYNWGYPACLKNAIDYLYHEWKGKPAMLVTYGGHGGGKCYSQLKQVLEGLDVKVTGKGVLISYPSKKEIVEGIPACFDLGGHPGIRENTKEAFGSLLSLLTNKES